MAEPGAAAGAPAAGSLPDCFETRAAATRLDFRLKKHTPATLRSGGRSGVPKRRLEEHQIPRCSSERHEDPSVLHFRAFHVKPQHPHLGHCARRIPCHRTHVPSVDRVPKRPNLFHVKQAGGTPRNCSATVRTHARSAPRWDSAMSHSVCPGRALAALASRRPQI